MIVNSTVNNEQVKILSWVLYMEIKTFSLRDRRLISVSFEAYSRIFLPPLTSVRIDLLLLVYSF